MISLSSCRVPFARLSLLAAFGFLSACNPESDGAEPSVSVSNSVQASAPASLSDSAQTSATAVLSSSAPAQSTSASALTTAAGSGGTGGVMPLPSLTSQAGGGGSAGSGGETGGAGGTAEAGVDPCVLPEYVEPQTLSETGLYSDIAAGTLAAGVREYQPRFELWSDSAAKRRFVYLPPCSQINTDDANYWEYPQGTKLWKEFIRENAAGEPIRVETRLLHKYSKTKWFMTAFIWNAEQTEASIAEGDSPTNLLAAENAGGTDHDVPGQKGCESCHYNMRDKVLGFSALQLDLDAAAGLVDLQTLHDENLLTTPIQTPITLPGTESQQAALGYMHANCGHCHNPWSEEGALMLQFWLELSTLGSVEATPTYLTTVGQTSQAPQPPVGQPEVRVVPQDLENSSVWWRMTRPPVYPTTPQGGEHMPLIGTEVTDEVGLQLVVDWINSLEPVQ